MHRFILFLFGLIITSLGLSLIIMDLNALDLFDMGSERNMEERERNVRNVRSVKKRIMLLQMLHKMIIIHQMKIGQKIIMVIIMIMVNKMQDKIKNKKVMNPKEMMKILFHFMILISDILMSLNLKKNRTNKILYNAN